MISLTIRITELEAKQVCIDQIVSSGKPTELERLVLDVFKQCADFADGFVAASGSGTTRLKNDKGDIDEELRDKIIKAHNQRFVKR